MNANLNEPRRLRRADDMPRRPKSAYAFFFSHERLRISDSITESKCALSDGNDRDEAYSPSWPEDIDVEKCSEEESEMWLDQYQIPINYFEEKQAWQAHYLEIFKQEAAKNKVTKSSQQNGKIRFMELSMMIGNKWKTLHPYVKMYYKRLADVDSTRYKKTLADYYKKKRLEELIGIQVHRHGDSTEFLRRAVAHNADMTQRLELISTGDRDFVQIEMRVPTRNGVRVTWHSNDRLVSRFPEWIDKCNK